MAHSFLIFDFGADEAAAQQARHRLEGWKQAFRLDKKLLLKFDRKEEEAAEPASAAKSEQKSTKGSTKGKGASKAESKSPANSEEKESEEPAASADIRLLVRLDFSDHEKLSRQRWIERIPADELFKDAHPQVLRLGEGQFQSTSDLFDSLD